MASLPVALPYIFMRDLYKQICKKDVLWNAWGKIRENGIQSKSSDTQNQIAFFEQNAPRNINRISGQLSKKCFKFSPAIGIPQKRPGKSDRPIVSSPVVNRVVQRAILDVIQGDPELQNLYSQPYSFGGIKGMGVETAIKEAHKAVQSGGKYYASTDIKSFFTAIDRQKVIKIVREKIGAGPFADLFEQALHTELDNLEELKSQGKEGLFPIYEIGVAQGCCLSPLVGNILLNDFDKQLNTADVKCLRYIDDFIIIGPSMKVVSLYFNKAEKHLKKMGLNCYLASEEKTKYREGETSKGFAYLGCDVYPDVIRPSVDSWKRLRNSVDSLFQFSLSGFSDVNKSVKRRLTYSGTMYFIGHKIRGWGNQYSFCNDKKLMNNYDRDLRAMLFDYQSQFNARSMKLNDTDKAKMAGLWSLSDCNNEPIIEVELK